MVCHGMQKCLFCCLFCCCLFCCCCFFSCSAHCSSVDSEIKSYSDKKVFASMSIYEHPLLPVNIEADCLICYKIFPGSVFQLSPSQSSDITVDWSALYAQFNLEHSIAYLPNHFDRGHSHAVLVSIHSKKDVKCLIYKNECFKDTTVSSVCKSQQLRNAVRNTEVGKDLDPNAPLLQTIGEQLDMFVVMYDAEDLECAFPHCMMNTDNFVFRTHAVFVRDDSVTWMVKSVDLVTPTTGDVFPDNNNNIPGATLIPLKLTRDEKGDMNLLARRLETHIAPGRCEWIDKYK
jgi:hypothetical protein